MSSLELPRDSGCTVESCAYNHADAAGFIRLNALRMRIAANARQRRG